MCYTSAFEKVDPSMGSSENAIPCLLSWLPKRRVSMQLLDSLIGVGTALGDINGHVLLYAMHESFDVITPHSGRNVGSRKKNQRCKATDHRDYLNTSESYIR